MGKDIDVDLLVSEMEAFEQLMKASRATEYSHYSAAAMLADQVLSGNVDPDVLECSKQSYLKAKVRHHQTVEALQTFWSNNDA